MGKDKMKAEHKVFKKKELWKSLQSSRQRTNDVILEYQALFEQQDKDFIEAFDEVTKELKRMQDELHRHKRDVNFRINQWKDFEKAKEDMKKYEAQRN